jgi:SAM-dependent methyltransferase
VIPGEGQDYDGLWEGAWQHAATQGPGFVSRYRLLLRLLRRYPCSGRLLDVGAGRGHLLSRIAEAYPQLELHAHEAADGALEHLRQSSAIGSVFEGKLEDLPAGHYSAIVCSEVLEHMQQDRAAVAAMVGALAPGGRLFLTVPLREALWTPLDEAVGHLRRYAPGQLEGICRDHGLSVDCSLAVGAPFYNAYYKLLGGRSPEATADMGKGLLAGGAARVLTAIFSLETHWSSRWGGRGVVVARKG